MLMIKDWFFGKRSNNNIQHNDDEDDEDDDEKDHRYTKKNIQSHHSDEEEDDDNDKGHNAYDDWVDEYENDDTDYKFFEELESVHKFKPGELLALYHAVREIYIYELISMKGLSLADIRQNINTYVQNYLGYLIGPRIVEQQQEDSMNVNLLDDIPAIRTYQRIIYIQNDASTPTLLCSQLDDDVCTFRVDSRLDFVHAYVMEKGIIDTLKNRGEEMLRYQNNEFIFMESLLEDVDTFKDIYRMRVSSQYKGHDMSNLTPERVSDSWVIYTRRSAPFFKRCVDIIMQTENDIVYSDETLHVEPIPFQQVLLLCGNFPGFLEKYAPSSLRDGPVIVNTSDSDDWISVPIWFNIITKLGMIVSSLK